MTKPEKPICVSTCHYDNSMQPQRIALFILLCFPLACSEDLSSVPEPAHDGIIRIPVVVHVLYSKGEFNISAEKIRSQIDALNRDFRKKNSDVVNTPAEFSHLVADVEIEFVLAKNDPAGNASTGITRTFTTLDGWSGHDPDNSQPVEELKLYFTSQGGHDAWPVDQYLNIWVVEVSDHAGRVGMPGYSHFPGTDARIDGVVIDPRVFGTISPLVDGHTLGRTATHEVGHWLNLLHIFASRSCESTDYVDDTPSAADSYAGRPGYPQYSCGHSTMFMNFMDYVDDDAMYMFTIGQKERMHEVFRPTSERHSFCPECL